MNSIPQKSWTIRASALGVGVALLGAAFAAAAPAQAVTSAPMTYAVSGMAGVEGSDGQTVYSTDVYVEVVGQGDVFTDEDGSYSVPELPNGTYTVEITAAESLGAYETHTEQFTIADADVTLDDVVLAPSGPALPALPGGTVAIDGTPTVGSVLRANTAGWPDGATLTYQWGFSTGESGGPIDGATEPTYTVTAEHLGHVLSLFVTGSADGFEPTTVSSFMEVAVAPAVATQQPAAAAPVADSTELAAFLAAEGVTTAPQTSAGLPAGALNPALSYTAQVTWADASDSFVDVYLYSTPTFVGTFPVVDGVARITLGTNILGQLAAGEHTLVVTGQTSGSVQSVAVNVAATLAETGVAVGGPLAVAAVLLVLGGVFMLIRRRRTRA